jgi:hypothetical protein
VAGLAILGGCPAKPPRPFAASETVAGQSSIGEAGHSAGGVEITAGTNGDEPAAAGGPSPPAQGAAPASSGGEAPGSESRGGAGSEGVGGAATGAGTGLGFSVKTPQIEVGPVEDRAICYYFRTSNDEDASIREWESTFTEGISHLSLVLTSEDENAPGTLSSVDCGLVVPGRALGTWVYSAWTPQAGWAFAADDQGTALGKAIKADQSAYLVMHLSNPGQSSILAWAELKAIAHPPGALVTPAEPYVTYHANISIPPSTQASAQYTCPVPAGSKFTWMTMFSRKQSVRTYVQDGTTLLFEDADWNDPGARTSITSFATQQVTYGCDYVNGSNRTIVTGTDPASDESCMMLSYQFPATKPSFCLNASLLP